MTKPRSGPVPVGRVGLFFAIPVVWLSWTVAYRWMQYGHRAALDHAGTQTPMLAGQ